MLTRRSFVAAATAPFLARGASDSAWIDLFDGHSLKGWAPSENHDGWKVVDGKLSFDGDRSHLFYTGEGDPPLFRNFELEAEVFTKPLCNSGIYFHTTFQEKGFPIKGFEVQINNTAAGEGSYRERKKTGSLYGIRNVYKQIAPDEEWSRVRILVRGKNVQIWINGMQTVNYTEPTPPVIASSSERERFLDRGTFALQGHDQGSKVQFKTVRVRKLADDAIAPDASPVPPVDDLFRDLLTLGSNNYPVVDFHVHLKGGLDIPAALAKSRRDGVFYGIAANLGQGQPIADDAGALKFIESLRGACAFVGMQAEGREWLKMFSRATCAKFDYIFSDSMTWTDNRGKRMRLWLPDEVGVIGDAQEFMDVLVDRTVGILEREPIDIYANPTFLPSQLQSQYDTLWTDERIRKVVTAAVAGNVAIELNNRYKLPGERVVAMAKDMKCKFTYGSNNAGSADLQRCEYGVEMTKKFKLAWQDIWVPGAFGPKAIDRKV